MEPFPNSQIFEILMVEDNLGDVLLMTEAFKEGKIPVHLNVVGNGEEALDYLHRSGKHPEAKDPDLVLLDLNLPRMDGRAFLREMKSDPLFKSIPVIVLTSSRLESDIREVYEMNGNCYLLKPTDIADFNKTVQTLQTFWLSLVKLPTRPSF